MNRSDNKIAKTTAEVKTESPERRKFLQRFLGIGILAYFFRPDPLPARPSSPSPSKKADFWQKGDRLAG